MAYDEDLADRVRELVAPGEGVTEKKMFGGLAFLVHGRMAVAAAGRRGLLLRVDPAQSSELVQRPRATRFVMNGREMNGWLHIDLDGDDLEDADTADEFERWVGLGVAYARSLPAKRETA